MLAMPDAASVLMERQYRYALRQHVYELPAGKIDPGEDALATAKRELLEETGYRAREWRHLLTTYPVVGYSDERIELYLARGLEHVGHALDEGEFLSRKGPSGDGPPRLVMVTVLVARVVLLPVVLEPVPEFGYAEVDAMDLAAVRTEDRHLRLGSGQARQVGPPQA